MATYVEDDPSRGGVIREGVARLLALVDRAHAYEGHLQKDADRQSL